MNYKITILIPTYNRIQNLKKTIYSLTKLDSNFFKIFIQDNASTDGTYDYLVTLEKKYDNKYIPQNMYCTHPSSDDIQKKRD